MTIEEALKELMATADWSCREDVSMWAGEARKFLRDHASALLSALADQRRLREAATGECMEVGNLQDAEGNEFCGAIIQSTPDQLRRGGPVVYRRVAIVPLDQEGE